MLDTDKASLEQARQLLCCNMLASYDTTNVDDLLRKIYLANAPASDETRVPQTLDALEYLSGLQSIKKPADLDAVSYQEITDTITTYRRIQRQISLQIQFEQLQKIRNPDPFVKEKIAIISRQIDRAQDKIKTAIEKYFIPSDSYSTEITQKAKLHLNVQDAQSLLKFSISQDFVDALRNNDFLQFVQIEQYIITKYGRLFMNDTMGADDYMPLLLHELSKTDFSESDYQKINLYTEMLNSLEITSGPLALSVINLSFTSLLIAAKQLYPDEVYAPRLEIKNKADLEQFQQICEAQTERNKIPDNHFQDKLKKISYQASGRDNKGELIQTQTTNPKGKQVTVNAFDLEKAKFDKENTPRYFSSVIIYLLQNVAINDIENKISDYVSDSFRIEFQRQLLNFQFNNALLVRQWQMQLQCGLNIAKRTHEIEQGLLVRLPSNPEAYKADIPRLAQISGYKIENTYIPLLATDTQKAVKFNPSAMYISEDYFKNKIRPRLEYRSHQIASKLAKNEFAADKSRITRELILNLKTLIETTNWNVARLFGMGGKELQIGHDKIIVPGHVYRIYQLCRDASEPNADIQDIYKNIQGTGKKASESFSLFRHKETQKFYDQLKTDHDEKVERKNLKQ